MASETERAAAAVFRLESAKIIASLVRIVRDVGLAEELAQDALVAALEQWPREGVPKNPAAWLMTAAKNRAINVIRRNKMSERKHEEIGRDVDAASADVASDLENAIDDDIGDDVLRLVFVACHPVLPTDARVALTLRMIGGLTTTEIAHAFLLPEPTVAQRIVRAKRTLADAHVPFEVPRGEDLAPRLSSVLAVIYLVFNEGYSATAGDDVMRPELCDDALRLGRILAELAPEQPAVLGLLALMELNASRSAARTDADGEPILLLDQNRGRWDWIQIERGLRALERAEALSANSNANDPYVLQAEIAACHARARKAEDTDWSRIAEIYRALEASNPSPVVALNHAVAVSMVAPPHGGPAAGLALLDAIANDDALREYHLLPSARADMLVKLGRNREARAEFERAASLTENARNKERLLARAAQCRD